MASPLAFGGSCVNGGVECPKGWAFGVVSAEGGLRTLDTGRQRLDRGQFLGGHPHPTPDFTHPSRSCSTIKRNGYLAPPASTAAST
jgi:hypothetical protein